MAYGDYGGYAYRQGERVTARSDVSFKDIGVDGDGGPRGLHHVLIGDGPIYLSLIKQTYVSLYRNGSILPIVPRVGPEWKADYSNAEHVWLDYEYGIENTVPVEFEIDGHFVTIWFERSHNYFTFIQLEQPDGIVWNGFSGYGVGAGFEEDDEGNEPTEASLRCEERLWTYFNRPSADALAKQIFRRNGASDQELTDLKGEE